MNHSAVRLVVCWLAMVAAALPALAQWSDAKLVGGGRELADSIITNRTISGRFLYTTVNGKQYPAGEENLRFMRSPWPLVQGWLGLVGR